MSASLNVDFLRNELACQLPWQANSCIWDIPNQGCRWAACAWKADQDDQLGFLAALILQRLNPVIITTHNRWNTWSVRAHRLIRMMCLGQPIRHVIVVLVDGDLQGGQPQKLSEYWLGSMRIICEDIRGNNLLTQPLPQPIRPWNSTPQRVVSVDDTQLDSVLTSQEMKAASRVLVRTGYCLTYIHHNQSRAQTLGLHVYEYHREKALQLEDGRPLWCIPRSWWSQFRQRPSLYHVSSAVYLVDDQQCPEVCDCTCDQLFIDFRSQRQSSKNPRVYCLLPDVSLCLAAQKLLARCNISVDIRCIFALSAAPYVPDESQVRLRAGNAKILPLCHVVGDVETESLTDVCEGIRRYIDN